MAEKINMTRIAKRLGVSKNTVSLALRGMPGLSSNTRKLILDTAAELGYSYRTSCKSEEAARSLCLVIPKSAQDSIDFFSLIQMGIEDEAKKNKWNTILHYYDENDEEFQTPLCIKDGMISGIITLGRVSEKIVLVLQSYQLPIITVDNYFDDLEIDCVLTDNHSGGYIATQYLLKNGHKKISFFGNIGASISYYDRYMGYRKALENHGINPDMVQSCFTGYEANTNEEAVHVMKDLKKEGKLPTSFVCRNDACAILLYKILKQLDIAIPEEVSVVGFDDISSAADVAPELTTMQVNKEWMGRMAVIKLIARLKERDGIPEKLLLSAILTERNSVRRLT